MSDGTRIQKELLDAIRAANAQKTKAYDVTARVTRVEDGKMYVHIPGGVDETPVDMTVSAKAGDLVKVRVANGRAWVTGNATAPPTDDTKANHAYQTAMLAQDKADNASEAAKTAWQYADTAREAADSAQSSAITANNAANNALVQLSVVEDVAGTLAWIQEHGSYVETTDTSVQPGTIYFELISGQYVPIANPDPEANPQSEGWYVLDVSDSQAQYIMAHLAVTSAGLWVLPAGQYAEHQLTDANGDSIVDSDDNPIFDWSVDPQRANGYKVLLSATGMAVFDETGAVVAVYSSTTTIGNTSGKNVFIDQDYVKIRNALEVLASFGADGAKFGKDTDESTTKTDSTGLYVNYRYVTDAGDSLSVPVIVLKPYNAGDNYTIPILSRTVTADGTTKKYSTDYISENPEEYITIEHPEDRVFAVLVDDHINNDYTVEVNYDPDLPEMSSMYIVFNSAPELGATIKILMNANPMEIMDLYGHLKPFYPEYQSIYPSAVFSETVGFLDTVQIANRLYVDKEWVRPRYKDSVDILEFGTLRIPGIATAAGTVYATLILDKPIDPAASVSITYTGGYIRGAGASISGATITASVDSGGHALEILASKATSFTQYETYMITLTGVTITFS